MPVRTVLRMGHPFLNKTADLVTKFDVPELNELIIDMFDTMAAYKGAGLAAPQIGVGLRVVIFGAKTNPRYPQMEPVPMTILINPMIDPVGEVIEEGWEGCLSVPGLRGLVPRYSHIRYCGYDQIGNPIAREVEGFHARVVQHECDHLDGILFPHRIKDFSYFGFEEELFLDKEDKPID